MQTGPHRTAAPARAHDAPGAQDAAGTRDRGARQTDSAAVDEVVRYHEATKHAYGRFARSLGFLDWAAQPDPFRRYAGARLIELPRTPVAGGSPAAIGLDTVGELLRCALGLSAWKQFGASRWALRVNPSSGNLHPTEAYVVWDGRVCHYAPHEHALEVRCELAPPHPTLRPAGDDWLLVGLSSIHWREAWKYGERAFRYCQHDVGHAIGALSVAAALLGWRVTLLPRWSDEQIAALFGLDRAGDADDAEPEAPDCIAIVSAGDPGPWLELDPESMVQSARAGVWHGTANRLSGSRVEWPIIDDVSAATAYSGVRDTTPGAPGTSGMRKAIPASAYDRPTILQRRSATAFDARYALRRETFLSMLSQLEPGRPLWDVLGWPPQVHLALFVHRVHDVTPGVYAYLRDAQVLEAWRSAMRDEFLWEQVEPGVPLYLLVPIDARGIAQRLSCDQAIAGDGFFSLGMIARFDAALRERGASFYRRLYWECGLIGQALYLEAEAAGVRATGIGCFYDDPVHEALGLRDHAWQSLYHLAIGVPVEDTRLTTESGYAWEQS